MFRVSLPLRLKKLETIFQNKVFLHADCQGKYFQENDISALNVTAFRISSLLEGPYPGERRERGGELGELHHPNILSLERMQYLDQEGKVVNTAKDGNKSRSFPAIERCGWPTCAPTC